MANIKSAQKRIRQTERRTAVNKTRRTRIRSFIRKVEEAIEGGKKKEANEALKIMQPELMSGVTHGLFKKNTASRRMSRLSARAKALS